MTNDPQEELISAYLDGELSVDEQRQVERLLVDSAEYRQLYDELRALHGSFEGLPRYKLPEDLSQRVLRRAEQELLRDGTHSRTTGGAVGDTTERHVVRAPVIQEQAPEPAQRSMRSWRSVFWPVMVVAAAIFMMVFGPKPRNRGRDIARAPAHSSPAAGTPLAATPALNQPPAEIGAAPADPQADLNTRSYTDENPTPGEGDRKSVVDGKRLATKRDSAAEGRQEQEAVQKDGTAADGPVGVRARSAELSRGLRRKAAADVVEGERSEADRAISDDMPLKSILGDNGAAADDKLAADKLAADAESGGISAPAAPRKPGFAGRAMRGAGNKLAQEKAAVPGIAPVADSDSRLEFFEAPDAVAMDGQTNGVLDEDAYVIEVNLTPAAARDGAFEKLLKRHQLVQLSADEPADLAPDDQLYEEQKHDEQLHDEQLAVSGRSAQNLAAKTSQTPAGDPKPPVAAAVVADQDAAQSVATPVKEETFAFREVTVTATADQFVATLRDLREHPDQFAAANLGIAGDTAAAGNQYRQLRSEQQSPERQSALDAAPAGSGKGEARDLAENKAAGQKTAEFQNRQLDRAAAQKAKTQAAPGAQAKKDGATLKELAKQSPAATLGDEMDDDGKDQNADGSESKSGVAKVGKFADDKAGEAAAKPGADKSRRGDVNAQAAEKLAENKGSQSELGPGKSNSTRADAPEAAAAPVPNSFSGQGAGGVSASGGGVQLNSKPGGLQLKLGPAQAVRRGPPGSNPAASASGGGGGTVGSANLAPGTVILPPGTATVLGGGNTVSPGAVSPGAVSPGAVSPGAVPPAAVSAGVGSVPPAGAALGKGGNGRGAPATVPAPAAVPAPVALPDAPAVAAFGAGAPAQTGAAQADPAQTNPARPAAQANDQFARQSPPTVKLIFRLHVAEPMSAESPVAGRPAVGPATPEPAAATPAEPTKKDAP